MEISNAISIFVSGYDKFDVDTFDLGQHHSVPEKDAKIGCNLGNELISLN
jgi:hypothetical protein